MDDITEQLIKEAKCAQHNLLESLLHEVYGKAKMARQLGYITSAEFMEINHMTVYFINTHVRELKTGMRKEDKHE